MPENRDPRTTHLDRFVTRLPTAATWSDLRVPPPVLSQLQRIASESGTRSPRRGSGVTLLFAGPPGTDKTLAAQALANALGLALYRVDLANVLSKYIGETEKNLNRVFDAAEQGGAILYFDEADALFGKRSEVMDAHDRYANIEVAYVLQRIEEFNGLAILATNLKQNIDAALLRRLRFIIEFPRPETLPPT